MNYLKKITLSALVICISVAAQCKTVEVDIIKKSYVPETVTIAVGDTVIWRNMEKRQYHNVWFKQFDKEEPQVFFPEESYQRTFNEVGEFPYECGPHPMMKGVVIVK
jgi:plastocyanin